MRKALRAQRKAISPSAQCKAARAVAQRVFRCAAMRRARRIAVYLSMASELPTAPLIAALKARRIAVFAPVILHGNLRFRRLSGARLHAHKLGMSQPRAGVALRASAMDVLVLPLLAFDARGMRLGQGGGYYDRALSRCRFRPYRLGVAYAQQQVGKVPTESFDQPLDAVLTERGLQRFNRSFPG
ncbi:MAG: 5-formyltetrahydrofolate cyclo-ligase [Stagnimonas sp.]|nr:5-formyltetrahydrofolate cyclo-ligase [Stagnimonas sp.]